MEVRGRILIYIYKTAVFLLICALANVSTLSTDRPSSLYLWKDNVNGVEDTRQINWAPVAHLRNSARVIPRPPSGEVGIEEARIWGRQPLSGAAVAPSPTGDVLKSVEVGVRFNFQTPPRPTNRRGGVVFPIKKQANWRRM